MVREYLGVKINEDSKYLFETSNYKHPGLCIMKNGKGIYGIFSNNLRMTCLDSNIDLFFIGEKYFDFAVYGLSQEEQKNFVHLATGFINQIYGVSSELLAKNEPVKVLDFEYFDRKFRESAERIAKNKSDIETESKSFKKALQEATENAKKSNQELADKHGIKYDNNDFTK